MTFFGYSRLKNVRQHNRTLIQVCLLALELQDGCSMHKVVERFRMCGNEKNILWDFKYTDIPFLTAISKCSKNIKVFILLTQ